MQRQYSRKENILYVFVCLFFASLNFEMFSPFIEDFSVAKMTAFLYIGVSLIMGKNLLSVKKIERPLFFAFSMFVLMVISSIINLQNNRSVFDVSLFFNIIMFWMMLNHYRRDDRIFREGLLWFSVSSFVIGVLFYFNIGVSISSDLRVVVFGENANTLGVKMATGALFLLCYCLSYSTQESIHIHKPWLLIMLIPMLSLMLSTASRVSLLIFATGAVLLVLLRPSKKKGVKFIWLILGGVALFYAYQVVQSEDVLMARMEETIDEGNVSNRDYIWAKYLELIKEHPIIGVGFTGAEQYAMDKFGMLRSPHNVFIEVALYSGILGLICFFAFFYCIIHDVWKYFKKQRMLAPLVLLMSVLGMLLSGQALNVKLFWVLAAYAISYRITPNLYSQNEAKLLT